MVGGFFTLYRTLDIVHVFVLHFNMDLLFKILILILIF
jgi:hypothetical protein